MTAQRTYAEKQWEDRTRIATKLMLQGRPYQFIKQVTKLSWEDIRMVITALGKAKEEADAANKVSAF